MSVGMHFRAPVIYQLNDNVGVYVDRTRTKDGKWQGRIFCRRSEKPPTPTKVCLLSGFSQLCLAGFFPTVWLLKFLRDYTLDGFLTPYFVCFFFGFSNRILTLHLFDAYRTLMQTRSQDCVFLGGAQLQCLGRYISSTTILLSPASIVNCFSYRV